jgi:predicted small lipoprotein YifL
MADKPAAFVGVATLMACALAGCGQKGPLYLPEAASEVVTRPADSPPAENTQAPNSPTTPDSPSAPPPAPEVTAPEGTPAEDDSKSKKEKGAATPPPPK